MEKDVQAWLKACSNYQVDRRSVDRRFSKMSEPLRDYIIFMTPRSGSTWLSDVIMNHGGFGQPLEWFSNDETDAAVSNTESASPDRYIRHIRLQKADAVTGIFGAKISFFQFEVFENVASFFEVFDVRRTSFFYLTRRDTLAQAISLYKAAKSQIWHATGNSEREPADVSYDPLAVMGWVEHLLHQEHGFETLFTQMNIRPVRLVYEDMIAAGAEKVCRLFCERLGVEFNGAPQSAYQKLATPQNEEFAQRLAATYDLGWLRNRPVVGVL